jgi:ribosomal protein S18 acetylase RimI-like enzyme
MKIIFKQLQRKDFRKIIDFAIEGMKFSRYVDNPLALRLYGRYFMYLELERASQVIAAYSEGRLVGILMADMNNQPKQHSSFWRALYVKLFKKIMGFIVKGGADIYEETNKAMFETFVSRTNPDGEICFLVADPSIHGKGIGTQLLEELGRREKGKLIYLYTDNDCSYQFYERKGFERSEEKEITMSLQGKTVALTCFLYSKRL